MANYTATNAFDVNSDQSKAAENLRRWYGGDFGGPSSGAGGFFGGRGGPGGSGGSGGGFIS